ncbi:endolytic transglycosylase MltG [Bacillus sp. FJAT-45350]|uniref:endolytic transglycosylase MltG n=1 Tax=Bacillus sp. FJAT-45350 TaxID=2011014 RepID=UPI000BB9B99D|nr:endolytic transglycosylase MltG [Bacillus sp. FJAT-45350]
MTPNGIRGFAIGLFIATSLFASIYFFGNGQTDAAPYTEAPSLTEEEMTTMLENAGYIVLTEEKYEEIAHHVDEEPIEEQAEEIIEDEPMQAEPEETQPETPSQQVYYSYVNIQSGMSSSEVAGLLERANIIESRDEFLDYMRQQKLNQSIRVGEYELNSNMSIAEIAQRITF